MKNKKKYNNDISLDIPMQSGIHDNYKSGLSRNIGTSVHVGYLHKTDDRRHKSRCMYYDKLNKACKCVKCRYYGIRCSGSAHCIWYQERRNNEP